MNTNERFSKINFNGHEIWVTDFSDLKAEDIVKLANEAANRIKNSGRDDLLVLDIVERVSIDNKVAPALKNFTKEAGPHMKKYAAVGVRGFARVIASSINFLGLINLQVFDTIQEAKEYLVS